MKTKTKIKVYMTNCSLDSEGFNFRDAEYSGEYDKIKKEAKKTKQYLHFGGISGCL